MDLPHVINLPDIGQLVSSPTYTEIFAATVGAAGTDADGMPMRLADLADRIGAFEADVPLGDADLADAATAATALDPAPLTALRAALPAVTAAGDKMLAAIDGLTLGQVPSPGAQVCAPGSTVQGLTVGQPDPNPYPQAAPTDRPVQFRTWPVMCLNDPQVLAAVAADTFTHDGSLYATAALIQGDPGMFSLSTSTRNDDGKAFVAELDLTIKPTTAGRFSAVIRIDSRDGQTWGGNIYYQVSVTIVDPKA